MKTSTRRQVVLIYASAFLLTGIWQTLKLNEDVELASWLPILSTLQSSHQEQ